MIPESICQYCSHRNVGGAISRCTHCGAPLRAAAHKAAADNPKWDSVILHDVGHTPQLEDPEPVIRGVSRWLDRHELGAGSAPVHTTTPDEDNR